jgi:hypothetical protein
MTAALRKPSTALQWHPHSAATESAIIDMANSRQLALRIRLRNFYWLNECRPIGTTSLAMQRKKMVMIDPRDVLTEDEVKELLTDHYGFYATSEGLIIPELDESRISAVVASDARADRAGAGGRAKALKAKESQATPSVSASDPSDF